MAAERGNRTRGIIALGVVVLAWGTVWPVNKALLAYISPIWSIALRVSISTLALFVISLVTSGVARPKREDAPVLVSMVLLHMVGFAVLSTLALQVVSAGQTTILAYTSVLWAPLGAALFLGERLTARRALGLGLGALGLAMIFNPLSFDWNDRLAVAGNGALLVAAMLWGASIVHNRAHRWHATPFQLAPWQGLLATALLALIAWLVEGMPAFTWTPYSVGLVLFASIPGTALAYWAAAVASSELPAAVTGIGLLGVPAVSIVVALLLLGEQPTLAVITALALLLAGVVVGMTGAGKST